VSVRVAIVTESFLPSANGVTTSVCRIAECLRAAGHEALIVAPRPAPDSYAGYAVHPMTSVPVRQFPVGLPTGELEDVLARFAPDVVHAASPFILGARGLAAAARLGIPSVAVYQTDMASYIHQHGPGAVGRGASRAAWRWIRRIHTMADLTLAPSSAALSALEANGIPRTALWGRGVDTGLFHPGWHDDACARALRRGLAPRGETLIGYVGRLAPEKELHRLAELADLPHSRLVLVGDGPDRARVGALLAEAVASSPARPNPPPVFLGRRDGDDLARAYAALDVFVHTGTKETFGQTLQEAAAMGLAVVAPARGGPLDLVADGDSGLLFDPDRPGALREHVGRLAADPAARGRMGSRGVQQVAGRSWQVLVAQLLGHYEQARSSTALRAA
jgi:phosphatidylinositol alpha 1,6-mannosyltransferase